MVVFEREARKGTVFVEGVMRAVGRFRGYTSMTDQEPVNRGGDSETGGRQKALRNERRECI